MISAMRSSLFVTAARFPVDNIAQSHLVNLSALRCLESVLFFCDKSPEDYTVAQDCFNNLIVCMSTDGFITAYIRGGRMANSW
jgi:hypothetical protein